MPVGDFHVNRGPPTVPLSRTSRNMFFFKSRNLGNAGTLCTGVTVKVRPTLLVVVVMLSGLPEMVNQNQLF